MTDGLLTKDVLLDVSVNIIPFGIILIFAALYLSVPQWGIGVPLKAVVRFLPIIIGLLGLGALTYLGAAKVET